ncbi:MAG: endo alpha-1,4 polygalactosaminidase [Myxococcales bacterium]|nr:endo alpha-1,4 polygalactosaminidase [Myxococcales bacterium]
MLPTANTKMDYQLGGAYSPPSGVGIVSRDRTEAPAEGIYNICYINGFQTQPDEEDFWFDNHPDLLLRNAQGNLVIDPDWDEYILDVRTDAKRAALAAVVGGWIEGCANAGFKAVEIDNLDTYSRSGGLITQDQAVLFMRALADRAHQHSLAIAQKNSAEILDRQLEMATDFAIVEECNRWNECQDFTDVYGDQVYVIEYRRTDFDKGCRDFPNLSIVLRDLQLRGPGHSQYVYDAC